MPVPASTPLPKPLFLLISQDVRFIVPSQNGTLSCDLLFSFSLRPHLNLLGNPVLGPFSLLFNWINSSALALSALLHTAQCKCPARPLMEVRWGHCDLYRPATNLRAYTLPWKRGLWAQKPSTLALCLETLPVGSSTDPPERIISVSFHLSLAHSRPAVFFQVDGLFFSMIKGSKLNPFVTLHEMKCPRSKVFLFFPPNTFSGWHSKPLALVDLVLPITLSP